MRDIGLLKTSKAKQECQVSFLICKASSQLFINIVLILIGLIWIHHFLVKENLTEQWMKDSRRLLRVSYRCFLSLLENRTTKTQRFSKNDFPKMIFIVLSIMIPSPGLRSVQGKSVKDISKEK